MKLLQIYFQYRAELLRIMYELKCSYEKFRWECRTDYAPSKQLSLILKNQKHIMATIEEVQQAVADLQASLDQKQSAIAAAIAALEAQISGGATPEQLQGIVDSLKAVQTDVESTPTA